MRHLADYVLKGRGEEIPVSAPVRGDLRRSSPPGNHVRSITLGLAALDADAARRLVGQEARLVTNIESPARDVGRLRVLEVDTPTFVLVAEVLAGAERNEGAGLERVEEMAER